MSAEQVLLHLSCQAFTCSPRPRPLLVVHLKVVLTRHPAKLISFSLNHSFEHIPRCHLLFRALPRNVENINGMDAGADVRAELDAFSRFLPLPYRVAIILVAGKPYRGYLLAEITDAGRRLGLGSQSAIFRYYRYCMVPGHISSSELY